MTDQGPAKLADNPLWAVAATLIGTALFCGLIELIGFGANGAADPRAAWILTPVFVAPLGAWLVWRGKLGVGGLIGLVILLTAAHFLAIIVASMIYKAPFHSQIVDLWSMVYDSPEQKAARAHDWSVRVDLARRTAVTGGAVAGAVGALAGFIPLLLFGRAFRRPRALTIMAATAAILAGVGAYGLSGTLPSDKRPAEFALQLFAPWQAVFGLALAGLFVGHSRAPRLRNPGHNAQRTGA